MLTVRKQVVAIYVDRSSGGWIVRDSEGNLWILPSTDHPWDDRQPFEPTEETELELVPGHYQYMLGLPISNTRNECIDERRTRPTSGSD
jgi:hypothetical protein